MGRMKTIARRTFVIGSVAVAGGVAFGTYMVKRDPANPLMDDQQAGEAVFNPWVKIDGDKITLITPHADKGQGAVSFQAALLAEELDVEFGQFETDFGKPSKAYWNTAFGNEGAPFMSTDKSFMAETTRGIMDALVKVMGVQGTGGSSSVPDSYEKLRRAGAVARETLKMAAANKTGVSVELLKTANGMVILPDGKSISWHCQVVLASEDCYFCFMLNIEDPSALKGFRFPRDVVSYTVWAYHRFALSLRDVEDLLAARGIIVSYETVRDWVNRFGHQFAAKIRRDRPTPSDKWHLDEVVIKIKGKTHWLWRAVDGNGDVLDILLQSRRNKAAAKRFLKKLLKRWGQPQVLISDKLGSYGAAKSEVAPGLEHRQHKGLNNRSEASHRHTRRREKIMGRFKSPRQAQRFLSVHDQTCAIFRPKRHLLSAKSYRHARSDAFDLWAGYATELTA